MSHNAEDARPKPVGDTASKMLDQARDLRPIDDDKRSPEQAKAERVRKAKADRARELELEAQEKRDAARSLLPDDDALQTARDTLHRRARSARLWLYAQLLVFVALPTAFVGYYYGTIATPLYEVRSIMVVSNAASESEEGLGGILGAVGGSPSNLQEAFMAHEFIRSRAMMDQLEQDLGLTTLYSGPVMDPVHKLRDIPGIGLSKDKQFSRFVNSAINIQTGMLTLYVRALSPQDAMQISELTIDRVAERVNALSSNLSDERIKRSDAAVTAARAALLDAQASVTHLQISSGEADPQTRIQGVYRTIAQLQADVEVLRSKIAEAKVADQGTSSRTQRLMELEEIQITRIAELRQALVSGQDTYEGRALNELLLEYEQAALQVSIAQEALTAALTSQIQVREKAALGRSQFQVVVPPSPADLPTHPNILNAVLICLFTTLSLFSLARLLRRSPLA